MIGMACCGTTTFAGGCSLPSAITPITCTFFLSSGGLVQYEVNGVVLKLGDYGVTPPEIDNWLQHTKTPSGLTKLNKRFFEDRIVVRPGAHIKAFASEVLTAVTLLGFFLSIAKSGGL